MTRAAVHGEAFRAAVAVLGLDAVDDRPDVVLVDLGDPVALAAAATVPAGVPRVVLAGAEHGRLLRAAGCSAAIAPSAEPAAVGPLIAAAAPARPRSGTRLVIVTGTRGGIGRTLLVTGLAARLATRMSVLVVDATGSGAAGWWLGLAPAPWSDLEGLVDELTAEHLAIVAAERERVRVIGGAPAMPSAALLGAIARVARTVADVAVVDAPLVFDDRARTLASAADRVLLVAPEGTAPLPAAVDPLIEDARTWLVASRSRAERIGAHDVMRALPDDPAAVRAAEGGPSAVGGALGRAYDELADLLALDIA